MRKAEKKWRWKDEKKTSDPVAPGGVGRKATDKEIYMNCRNYPEKIQGGEE